MPTTRMSVAEYRRQIGAGGKRKVAQPKRGEMNRTESEYAALYLEPRKLAGEIKDYWFERVTLRLARRMTYTPDFLVELIEGVMEMHEVKGAHVREDALVKFKAAAEAGLPFQFFYCQKRADGWRIRRYEEM